MKPDDLSRLPPFVPDEALFLVDADTRDLAALDQLDEIARRYGGALAPASRDLDNPPPLIEGERPLMVLPVLGLNARTFQEGWKLFAQLDCDLRRETTTATWQPNWTMGASPGGGDGGTGAGPGARPLPLGEAWVGRSLPLRDALLDPLRAAAQPDSLVRLVVLDAWNPDARETARLQPLYRLLNDGCEGAYRRLKNYHVDRGDDPFPMPDHGLFAAWLAGQVIGGGRLRLHDSVLARLDEAAATALGSPAPGGCVTVEAVRVLDDYGVGDSQRLIEALVRIANSIQPGERVIVNLSLFANIPNYSGIDAPLIFDGRWPWQLGTANPPDRLDRGLYQAVRMLHDRGALLVAAAGNSSYGEAAREMELYPAAYDEVLGVTAANVAGTREAHYANRVAKKGVALFAGDLRATGDGDGMALDDRYPLVGPFTDSHVPTPGTAPDPANQSGLVAWAGTSFATPLASGLAALLWAAQPTASAAQVRAGLAGLASRTLESGTPYIDLMDWAGGEASAA